MQKHTVTPNLLFQIHLGQGLHPAFISFSNRSKQIRIKLKDKLINDKSNTFLQNGKIQFIFNKDQKRSEESIN